LGRGERPDGTRQRRGHLDRFSAGHQEEGRVVVHNKLSNGGRHEKKTARGESGGITWLRGKTGSR